MPTGFYFPEDTVDYKAHLEKLWKLGEIGGEFDIKTFFQPIKIVQCFISAIIDGKTNGTNK